MEREIMKDLIEWKNSWRRKPLILQGVRQTGKTWILKEFGKREYKSVQYLSLDRPRRYADIFTDPTDVERILRGIEISTEQKHVPGETLLILDEIQEMPNALKSLKYFCEDRPDIHVAAAGSLLGIALRHKKGQSEEEKQNSSFPVGKVNFLDMYPMTFPEFLKALGREQMAKAIEDLDFDQIQAMKEPVNDLLKQYYYVGGMPEVVAAYARNQDFSEVRVIQEEILDAYDNDFSKHAPDDQIGKIREIWQTLPGQFARENHKFMYSIIRKGARAKDYEAALYWLKDAGMIYQVHKVSKPGYPLKGYEQLDDFKVYLCDTGLLSAMSGLSPKAVIEGNSVFTEFKGSLTEQYVLCQLVPQKKLDTVCYWSSGSGAEVDYVIQQENEIYPLEVKAEENLRAKSLRSYNEKYEPSLCLRTSLADFRVDDWIANIPLSTISCLSKWIESLES